MDNLCSQFGYRCQIRENFQHLGIHMDSQRKYVWIFNFDWRVCSNQGCGFKFGYCQTWVPDLQLGFRIPTPNGKSNFVFRIQRSLGYTAIHIKLPHHIYIYMVSQKWHTKCWESQQRTHMGKWEWLFVNRIDIGNVAIEMHVADQKIAHV